MNRETEIYCQLNKHRAQGGSSKTKTLVTPEILQSVTAFHRSLPDYRPTPIARLKHLARYLGLAELWVKDESVRFELKAFKVLGASYGIGKLLAKRLGLSHGNFTFEQLASHAKKLYDLTFVTATDGNHGRAVAWAAHKLGCKAVVYMPRGSSSLRLEAIRNYGAEASIIDGNYDDAVRLAAKTAEEKEWILMQDTSWPGYEKIPTYIMQGYTTLLVEAFEALKQEKPTHIFVQAGVGSMAASLQAFLCQGYEEHRPFLGVVEPTNADCFYRSIAKDDGKPCIVEGDLDTIMAGLACGEPSSIAWEVLKKNADAFITCSDQVAIRGMRVLGNPLRTDARVVSGESGAVTTGLIFELLKNRNFDQMAKELRLGADARVLVISTEGDTDPDHYRTVVW